MGCDLMPTALIIHGTKGSPNGNWFPWLSRQLDLRGYTSVIPQFPTPDGQNLSSWLSCAQEYTSALDQRTLLIGHSIGATFALRLLERLSTPICATALVAGVSGPLGLPDYDTLNATFHSSPFAWEAIRRNAGKVICLAGDNDPYVPPEQGRHIAEKLGSELTVVPGGGHLNAEFGFSTLPQLIAQFEKARIFHRTETEIQEATGIEPQG